MKQLNNYNENSVFEADALPNIMTLEAIESSTLKVLLHYMNSKPKGGALALV